MSGRRPGVPGLAELRRDLAALSERVPAQDIRREWRLDARVTEAERRVDGIVRVVEDLLDVLQQMSEEPLAVRKGQVLLTFDGTVVEVFGFPGTIDARFHVAHLELGVGEPDRRGARLVRLASRGKDAGSLVLDVSADEWVELEGFVDAIRASLPG